MAPDPPRAPLPSARNWLKTQKQAKTPRQDALDRKQVFKTITDSSLAVQWPAVPQPVREQMLDALLPLIRPVGQYKRALKDTRAKPVKEGPAYESPWSYNTYGQPTRPDVLDHIVVGINAVTKELEGPQPSHDEELDGRARKRRRKLEKLKEQVETDKAEAPRLAEIIRQTGVQPALAPAADAMEVDVLPKKQGRFRYSIIKRRAKRRRACREVFMARKRADELEAMERRATADDKMEEGEEEDAEAKKPPDPLLAVFVCRPDIDPPSLVGHLPLLTAVANHKQIYASAWAKAESNTVDPTVSLVQLNYGAEAVLCRLLNVRRAAVIGIRRSCPDIEDLKRLLNEGKYRPQAPWLSTSQGQHQPTAIRHLRTSVPVDPKAARLARKKHHKAVQGALQTAALEKRAQQDAERRAKMKPKTDEEIRALLESRAQYGTQS